MVSETEFNIPKIDSIHTELFQKSNYKALKLLGFKLSEGGFQKIFTNGKESIKVSLFDTGFQWIILFPHVCINKRTVMEPYDFSIQKDLTLVEIFAVLSREWKKIFEEVDMPDDLYFGHLYSEHIKSLK